MVHCADASVKTHHSLVLVGGFNRGRRPVQCTLLIASYFDGRAGGHALWDWSDVDLRHSKLKHGASEPDVAHFAQYSTHMTRACVIRA